MGILLIFLSIANIAITIAFAGIWFTNYYYYAPALLFLACLLYLLIAITFFKWTNKELEKQKSTLLSANLNINKIKDCFDKTAIIEFERNNGKWICKNDEIVLDLQGYLFQKSFIIAWIVRNIRYGTVSSQLEIIKLLNMNLKIKDVQNLKIRFKDKNKIKEYIVVKNYISKNTVLSRAITKSKYYLFFIGRYLFAQMKKVRYIDESVYLNQ